MIVYVESNFVLELVFAQEQHESCEQLLALAEARMLDLKAPAYCLAEPHEKLTRQARNRGELQRSLRSELIQLQRTEFYAERIGAIQDIEALLAQSIQEERRRFVRYRERLLHTVEMIPLTLDVLQFAASCEDPFGLPPQDAIVYASVVTHLRGQTPSTCCFLNKNSKDFDNPDIVDDLAKYHCRMIPSFDDGLRFAQSYEVN